MTDYIVNEDELKSLIAKTSEWRGYLDGLLKRAQKQLQPVEMIAEGEINATKTRTEHWQDFEIGQDFCLSAMCELIEDLINKDVEKVKIFIQEVK